MKDKEIEALESYFKTDNEHWNEYTFEMLCEVLKQGQFEDSETPLELFGKAIEIFIKDYQTPLKAVNSFTAELDKNKLTDGQKLFVSEWVLKYLKYSEFDNEMTEIKDLLKGQIELFETGVRSQKPEYDKPLVGSIRDTLKELMEQELKQLPDTLKELEPLQRLNVMCKLIPYVSPKVVLVHSNKGEPDENKIQRWHD